MGFLQNAERGRTAALHKRWGDDDRLGESDYLKVGKICCAFASTALNERNHNKQKLRQNLSQSGNLHKLSDPHKPAPKNQMKHKITLITSSLTTCILLVITGTKILSDWTGRALLWDDPKEAGKIFYHYISFILQLPWPALLVVTAILAILTAYLYKITFSRPYIIQKDNQIVDLRSSDEIDIDTERGINFLIRPTQNVNIFPPKNGAEGIFRIFILNGDHEYEVNFSKDFEYVGEIKHKIKRAPNTLYEVQVIAIKSGRNFRYFVSDNLAILDEANEQSIANALIFS